MMQGFIMIGLLITLSMPLPSGATPYTPGDDSTVLEQLPQQRGDNTNLELRRLHRELRGNPRDLALALRVAQHDIEQARRSADPRYLGHAQAALGPWWNLQSPPVAVLVLRAIIKQANHDFSAALDDLDNALLRDPYNAQALLTRAGIQQAQGDYGAARNSCLSLLPRTSALIGYTCLTAVMSLNGEAARSAALLQRIIAQSPPRSASQLQWTEGLLAETAARQNRTAAAQTHFLAALAAGEPDSYLLASYADFLLDTGRAADVVALLRDKTRADPLLLRLAQAEQVLGLPGLEEHVMNLRARFAASRLRGDVVHRREEARFQLWLEHNPCPALRLAEANWAVQREPADARVYLEAALACQTPERARPVLTWLEQNRLEDVRIDALAGKFTTGTIKAPRANASARDGTTQGNAS